MKKKKPEKIKRKNSQLDPLNSELGSFGLEPPKVYRREQQTSDNNHYVIRQNVKSPNSKNKKAKKEKPYNDRTNINKNKKKRHLKKKVRRALEIIGIVLALAIMLVVLSLTVFFKIDTITVKGNEKYSVQEITKVLPISKEKNLFLCDTNYAKQKLCEGLPYIYDVQIKRKLPSTIIVDVTEPSFIYYIKNSDNTFTYFDDNFKALETNVAKKAENGIELKNCSLSSATAGNTVTLSNKKLKKDLLNLMQVVDDLKLTEVTAIYSDNAASNYLVYENRIVIKVGDTKNLTNKVYAALTAIEKQNLSNPTAEGVLTSNGGKQVYFTEEK